MYVTHAEDKEDLIMITKEYLENYFKHHNKLVVFQGDVPLTITKEWHLHFNGGHHDFDIEDCEDLAELCDKRNVTLKPVGKSME